MDMNATGPKDFKDAASLLSLRRWTRRHYTIVFAVLLCFSIWWGPYRSNTRDVDAIHLEALVQDLGATSGAETLVTEVEQAEPQLQDAAPFVVPQSQEQIFPSVISSEGIVPTGDEDGPRIDAYGHFVPHHRKIYSASSPEKKYWLVWWGGEGAYNPNIIPHPTEVDRWILMAQHERTDEGVVAGQEFICIAGFLMDKLVCQQPPILLPVADSIIGNCTGDRQWVNMAVGPRDGRMFYGPDNPYVMYGSQSTRSCLGLWLQDMRMLLQPFEQQRKDVGLFREATDLQRPEPYHVYEKNFFLFWDALGGVYVHHDIYPKRVFAQLGPGGNAGEDLAPAAAESDARCMSMFMPKIGLEKESIHQATNSLSITMCARTDPTCVATDENTFIMTIFQWKSFHMFHGIYEPYIMLFKRSAPFAVHAIGQRPYWINGRSQFTAESGAPKYIGKPDAIPTGHSEMFYVTSISWKNKGQTYHGFVDDPLFLAFGIEDGKSGVIDVTAGDLMQDLAVCDLTKQPT
ncbi:hypothetical protein Slin15195_G112610 [Septoria linicola]|uniref:Uncharacterized protein n=1 Tax=Septoria linicola TaxID=215465 RepID=A0A9Q9B5W6_9PEZI|nr:hypothetical protein Slin15195_G112610 [Septoria linicola]